MTIEAQVVATRHLRFGQERVLAGAPVPDRFLIDKKVMDRLIRTHQVDITFRQPQQPQPQPVPRGGPKRQKAKV